ncbi:MAG: putative glycoside hydrolase [Patescibacteria group bacterium]
MNRWFYIILPILLVVVFALLVVRFTGLSLFALGEVDLMEEKDNNTLAETSEDTEEEEKDNEGKDEEEDAEEKEEKETFTPLRVETPEEVKALYMTNCYAGTPSLRDGLVSLIEKTELNSIVIDIKDYTGMISFKAEDPELADAYATHCPVKDMREFVYDLNEKGIYVIGRITVFQDKYLANKRPDLAVLSESDKEVWKDNKGISFTDPSAEEVWDYHIRLSKESYRLGFDELNFDYIRFPSDGPMNNIYFPHSEDRDKADVMEEFFFHLEKELEGLEVVTSADIFGLTTSAKDDLGIGQVWEKVLPYFDYLSPMVYPSHYPFGFKGLGDPNDSPYEVVKWSLDDAVDRTVSATTTVKTIGAQRVGTTTPAVYEKEVFDEDVIRPWIQDFRYGGAYTAEDILLQVKAVYDSGLDSWMLWDPANRYTPAALQSVLEE